MNFLPVTVVIPVLNEELNLPACLKALGGAFADVVVVDSGSTDRTCEIAMAANADILQFRWNGTFPKKRNWTLRNHTFRTPWVLFLDADERMTPECIEEMRRILPDTPHVGFWISFTNWFMGKPLRHGDVFRKLALFRAGAGEYERFPENGWSTFDMEVHEHPVLNGTTGHLGARIEHHDFRSMEHYLQKHDEYANWEVKRFGWLKAAGEEEWARLTRRQKFKYQNVDKWWFGLFYFGVCYFLKLGVLDRIAGLHFAWLKRRYFHNIRSKIKKTESGAFTGVFAD